MKKMRKTKPLSAEEIAEQADAGADISKHFTNRGKMMPAIQRVNVDFTADMLKELDQAAENMNISRQAVIKTLVRIGLNRHYLVKTQKKKLG
jgi:hypothetical protein